MPPSDNDYHRKKESKEKKIKKINSDCIDAYFKTVPSPSSSDEEKEIRNGSRKTEKTSKEKLNKKNSDKGKLIFLFFKSLGINFNLLRYLF